MGLMDQPPFPWIDGKLDPPPPYELVTREEWGAVPPTAQDPLPTPIQHVFFSYTETEPCNDKEECSQLLRQLQKQHMDEGYSDIRYSYVVGTDLRIYECRGWATKAGTYPLKPNMEDHVEISYVSHKGFFPEALQSCRGWQLIEEAQEKGLVDEIPEYDDDWHHPFNREEVDDLT